MFFGSILNAVVLCLFFAMAYKVFTLSSEINEWKELLREIRRNTNPPDSYAAQRDAAERAYTPPDLNPLAAEIDREDRAYEVPAEKITVLDPPRQ